MWLRLEPLLHMPSSKVANYDCDVPIGICLLCLFLGCQQGIEGLFQMFLRLCLFLNGRGLHCGSNGCR